MAAIPPPEARRPPKPAGVLFGSEVDPVPSPPYAPAGSTPAVTSSYPTSGLYAPPSSGLPAWLTVILVAVLVVGIVAGAVWLRRRGSEAGADTAASALSATPATVASGGHRFAKYIEIAGFRMTEERQKPVIKMVLINHSAGDLGEVKMRITVSATDGKQLGTTEVTASLGPLAVADVTAPFKSRLRTYELPDWQFIRATFEILSD